MDSSFGNGWGVATPEKPDTRYTRDAGEVLLQTLSDPLVDPERVVMLGHSEGSLDVSSVARCNHA